LKESPRSILQTEKPILRITFRTDVLCYLPLSSNLKNAASVVARALSEQITTMWKVHSSTQEKEVTIDLQNIINQNKTDFCVPPQACRLFSRCFIGLSKITGEFCRIPAKFVIASFK